MTREIVLDTETTGLNPFDGHRIVEIGCLELINHVATGRTFHCYINPERPMPEEAFAVHGLGDNFLKDQPKFSEIHGDFLNFIEDSPLVIHNAPFDMKFLNYELETHGQTKLPLSRAIDTLVMARRKFPGSPASLDALCKRFKIDNTNRTLHGALLDSELLALVYLELLGGRQPDFMQSVTQKAPTESLVALSKPKPFRPARPHAPHPDEKAAHDLFIAKIR